MGEIARGVTAMVVGSSALLDERRRDAGKGMKGATSVAEDSGLMKLLGRQCLITSGLRDRELLTRRVRIANLFFLDGRCQAGLFLPDANGRSDSLN